MGRNLDHICAFKKYFSGNHIWPRLNIGSRYFCRTIRHDRGSFKTLAWGNLYFARKLSLKMKVWGAVYPTEEVLPSLVRLSAGIGVGEGYASRVGLFGLSRASPHCTKNEWEPGVYLWESSCFEVEPARFCESSTKSGSREWLTVQSAVLLLCHTCCWPCYICWSPWREFF